MNLTFLIRHAMPIKLEKTISISLKEKDMHANALAPSRVNFTNMFISSFYLWRYQKPKNTLKTSVSFFNLGIWKSKSCSKNVDEIDTWGQFHKRSTSSFFALRSQRLKKADNLTVFFTLLGSERVRATHRTLIKLTPDLSAVHRSNFAHEYCKKPCQVSKQVLVHAVG